VPQAWAPKGGAPQDEQRAAALGADIGWTMRLSALRFPLFAGSESKRVVSYRNRFDRFASSLDDSWSANLGCAASRERSFISSLPGLTRQSMLKSSMKTYWVYILASRPRGTLYVGMTNDLVRRVYEHREGLVDGFSKEHRIKALVYYEQHATAIAAIQREKNIKHWSRKWKIDLIRSLIPDWRDLWEDIMG
jgi:putative endonuclease